ncbi:acyl-CoA dehydrogenase family protein [Streptomyces olivaceoviridis]|uniref:acyl-CoA dehydrogenase family protein n=1 Tax=Streptomyces olivaceoviridis TaxID=1921 RepID=UPI003694724D
MSPLQRPTNASHEVPAPPTEPDLVARALALGPVLRANAERTERERRMAPENLEGLRRSGLLRLTTPTARGGFGVSVRTQVEVGLALGRACPSTAWVAGIYNGVEPMTLMLSETARDEFYREGPDVTVCSVASVHGQAVRADGGVRFSGTWTAASGCEDARWALLGVPLPGPAGSPPSAATVLVPLEELAVRDTWHVAGMRGTGSQTLVADAVLVPDHRVISAAVAPSGGSGAGFPSALKIGATLNLLAPVVGAALGALDSVRETLASGRGIIASVYRDTTASPSAQMWLGEADRLIGHAIRLVTSAADAADAALTGDPLTLRERSALRMDMVAAIENARVAMSMLLDLNGTAGFAESHPLQRYWRDMETGSRHVQFNPFLTREDYGRLAVGIESPVSLLL